MYALYIYNVHFVMNEALVVDMAGYILNRNFTKMG